MIKVKIEVKENSKVGKLKEILDFLKKTAVFVGIPEEKGQRTGKDNLTNPQIAFLMTHGVRSLLMRKEMESYEMDSYAKAYQMYLYTFGSPLWQIPPRPIIEPAIEANKKEIAEELAEASKAFLDGKSSEGMMHLKWAGMLGQNFTRAWFTDPRNAWPPNAPSTIEAKGSDKPLISTGQLRKAITYVVQSSIGQIQGGYEGD